MILKELQNVCVLVIYEGIVILQNIVHIHNQPKLKTVLYKRLMLLGKMFRETNGLISCHTDVLRKSVEAGYNVHYYLHWEIQRTKHLQKPPKLIWPYIISLLHQDQLNLLHWLYSYRTAEKLRFEIFLKVPEA